MDRKLAIQALVDCGEVVLRCNGRSMQPLMSPGDALHIKRVDHCLLRVDDPVFVRVNGSLQVHKIGAIRNSNQWRIENMRGHVNDWVGAKSIYGLCVQVNDRIIVSEQDLAQRVADVNP